MLRPPAVIVETGSTCLDLGLVVASKPRHPKGDEMQIEGMLRSLLAAAASLLALTSSAQSQAQDPPPSLIGHITSE
jgi:hypothetical protein